MLLVAVRDLLFASKIDAAAKRVGAAIVWAPRGTALSEVVRERRPDALLVDLGEPRVFEELRAVRAELPGVRVVGYTGHLQADLLDEARSLGLVEVLTRGQLSASLDDVLMRAAAAAPPPA